MTPDPRPPLALLALLALTSAAVAGGGPEELDPTWRKLPPLGPVHFEEAVAGDLTGDGVADAVVLWDTTPVLLHGAAHYHASGGYALHVVLAEIPGGPAEVGRDLAILPGAGSELADAVVVAGDHGLAVWRWDGVAGFTRELLSGVWGAIGHVAVWAAPGAEFYWVVGVSVDGSAAYPLIFHRDTGNVVMQLGTLALGPGAVDDLALFNHDDDDLNPALALVRPDGLTVVDVFGNPLAGLPAHPAGAGGHVAVIATADGLGERLAWITGNLFGTSNWLHVLAEIDRGRGPAILSEPPVDLGPATVHVAAAGDWNGDGLVDLCVSADTPEPVVVFPNQAASSTFSLETQEGVLDPALRWSHPSGPVTALLFADLDHDGDDDLTLFDDPSDGGILYRSRHLASTEVRPAAETIAPLTAVAVDEDGDGVPELYDVSLPVDLTATFAVPAGATHVELLAWVRTDELELEGGPDGSDCEELDSEFGPGSTVQLTPTLHLPPPDPEVEDDLHYRAVEARFVRIVAGEPRVAYPPVYGLVEFEWLDPPTPFTTGLPALRGDMEPLDDIPPFGSDDVP